MKIVVNEDNIRIDKYLSENTEYSRSYIEKLIDEKCVLVNGKEVKASYKVCLNDEIEINDTLKKESDIKPVKMQLNIVYEDDDLMIINKPSGLVVHPGAGNYDNTLVNGLLNYTNNLSSVDDVRPGIVHRLDKDTSGLMVVAKNNKCHELLSEMFKKHIMHLFVELFPTIKELWMFPLKKMKQSLIEYVQAKMVKKQ